MERGWKPNVEISPACPRCGSSNTKFCYYNNYSLTQPRYFCKGCRRYWTKGGSLRNVPVGGGCRKTRRSRPTHIGGASSRNSPYGCALGGGGGVHINGNSMAETTTSSSSTMAADGSNIDLAAVYANFLNQRPQLPNGHVGPSMEVSGVDDMAMDVEFITHLPQENCVIENLGGLDSIQHYFTSRNNDENEMMSNYGLPPLPGEEMVWSNSEAQHPNLWNYGSFFRP